MHHVISLTIIQYSFQELCETQEACLFSFLDIFYYLFVYYLGAIPLPDIDFINIASDSVACHFRFPSGIS